MIFMKGIKRSEKIKFKITVIFGRHLWTALNPINIDKKKYYNKNNPKKFNFKTLKKIPTVRKLLTNHLLYSTEKFLTSLNFT